MNIITSLDFLTRFPMFGGLDAASIDYAISQAEKEYSTDLPDWLEITLNLIAHILTVRSIGVAQTVAMMGTANGTTNFTLPNPTYSWKGTSLQSNPYGQEVLRLLTGTYGGCLFL